MNSKRITTAVIAFNNLKHRPFRTVCLIILVGIFAFTILSGTILSVSLERGMESISDRLGADIMVVPKGNEQKAEGALLRGEPSTFYFNENLIEELAKVDGVEEVSPQLFISSFSASCCSEKIQMIGIDTKTDFIIQPWIKSTYGGELANDSVVVGSDITANVGENLLFFGRIYHVSAKMEKTGMGFDTSVFLNMEAAKVAAQDYKDRGGDVEFTGENVISSIFVNVKDNYQISKVARDIQLTNDDVDVVVSEDLLSNISKNMDTLLLFIRIPVVALWFLSFGILAIVFTVMINERKQEFGILRAIGATRKKLTEIVLTEASIVSVVGTVIGILCASLVIFPFNTYISNSIGIPYLQPPFLIILITVVISFIISSLSGPIASIHAAVTLGKRETYELMRRDG